MCDKCFRYFRIALRTKNSIHVTPKSLNVYQQKTRKTVRIFDNHTPSKICKEQYKRLQKVSLVSTIFVTG